VKHTFRIDTICTKNLVDFKSLYLIRIIFFQVMNNKNFKKVIFKHLKNFLQHLLTLYIIYRRNTKNCYMKPIFFKWGG